VITSATAKIGTTRYFENFFTWQAFITNAGDELISCSSVTVDDKPWKPLHTSTSSPAFRLSTLFSSFSLHHPAAYFVLIQLMKNFTIIDISKRKHVEVTKILFM
jgi:hypothetical protein